MSIIDKAKNLIAKNKGKAQDILHDNQDKVQQGLDKATAFADSKTGGKYSDRIDRAKKLAEGKLIQDDAAADADAGAATGAATGAAGGGEDAQAKESEPAQAGATDPDSPAEADTPRTAPTAPQTQTPTVGDDATEAPVDPTLPPNNNKEAGPAHIVQPEPKL